MGHELTLGENFHQGKTEVVGATGTGKSTLLLNLIIQDITNGLGVGVLDPHGDLIDRILGFIPEERFSDVVLLDPADAEYPVGLNILSSHSEIEKNVLSSDLVAVFRRLSTSWGDQMTSVLGNGHISFPGKRKRRDTGVSQTILGGAGISKCFSIHRKRPGGRLLLEKRISSFGR